MMYKLLTSLGDCWKKLMAWRDAKRDREKKVDDFFAPNGGFERAIKEINVNVENRIGEVGKEMKKDMAVMKERLGTMENKIQNVEDRIVVVDARVESVQEGLKTELFESLHQLWRECCLEQHYATLDQKERADKIYNAYHDFNGNGQGTRIYKEIVDLPTHDSI